MNMKEIAKELIEAINEVKKSYMKIAVSNDIFEGIDGDALDCIQKSLSLVDKSCELLEAEACKIELINAKLDKVLAKLEEKES